MKVLFYAIFIGCVVSVQIGKEENNFVNNKRELEEANMDDSYLSRQLFSNSFLIILSFLSFT
jgi:hypothetical protein